MGEMGRKRSEGSKEGGGGTGKKRKLDRDARLKGSFSLLVL